MEYASTKAYNVQKNFFQKSKEKHLVQVLPRNNKISPLPVSEGYSEQLRLSLFAWFIRKKLFFYYTPQILGCLQLAYFCIKSIWFFLQSSTIENFILHGMFFLPIYCNGDKVPNFLKLLFIDIQANSFEKGNSVNWSCVVKSTWK